MGDSGSGDTMAMHVAIARRRWAVAFFGPTCAQEIDLFGRGEKLITQVSCAPCYKHVCDEQNACHKDITVTAAVDAIERGLARWRQQFGAKLHRQEVMTVMEPPTRSYHNVWTDPRRDSPFSRCRGL